MRLSSELVWGLWAFPTGTLTAVLLPDYVHETLAASHTFKPDCTVGGGNLLLEHTGHTEGSEEDVMEDGEWSGASGGDWCQDGSQVHRGRVPTDDLGDEEGTQGEH